MPDNDILKDEIYQFMDRTTKSVDESCRHLRAIRFWVRLFGGLFTFLVAFQIALVVGASPNQDCLTILERATRNPFTGRYLDLRQ